MKHDKRVTNHTYGRSIKTDWNKVEEIKMVLDEVLKGYGFINVDCLTALCILAIESAYNGGVNKPQLLAKISQWWEEMDDQVNG